MARVRIGDVIEIPTPSGFAYAQFALKVPKWGALLRVLPGVHAERPENLERVVSAPERFVTFFPLAAAVSQGIFTVVSNLPVPASAQQLPTFKSPMRYDPVTKKGVDWWLWDGEREWRVGVLDAEQRRFPLRQTLNDTALIDRIVSGWKPEDEV